ncbi:MAG TPA: hypothetical protein VET48_00515 [Steroidobacteraceae bacterium]|nr:hypothetical protein [Steroidobacteraceae bacterium]
MSPQQIVGMAAKLFAIWLVVIAFQIFGAAITLKSQLGSSATFLLYFLPALPILLAVFLWLFPMTIADKLVPRTQDTNTLRTPARELTAVASIIIGLWVLIGTIPTLVTTLGMFLFSDETLMSVAYFTQERKLHFVGVFLQCAFALFLVFKPWTIARKVFPHTSNAGRDSE